MAGGMVSVGRSAERLVDLRREGPSGSSIGERGDVALVAKEFAPGWSPAARPVAKPELGVQVWDERYDAVARELKGRFDVLDVIPEWAPVTSFLALRFGDYLRAPRKALEADLYHTFQRQYSSSSATRDEHGKGHEEAHRWAMQRGGPIAAFFAKNVNADLAWRRICSEAIRGDVHARELVARFNTPEQFRNGWTP
jgi:hypothetical protein